MAKNPRNGCMAKLLALMVAGIVGLVSTGMATAQGYPAHPITMIVPFAAGGPTDTLARILAQRMTVKLGQSIVIDNVSGASGSIGVGRVARSSPDGYTLSIGNVTTHVFNGAIYPLPYDLLKDFEPIAMVASNPQLLLSKPEISANTLQELIAWIKARPGGVLIGTTGNGSSPHISGVYLEKTFNSGDDGALSWRCARAAGINGRADRHSFRSGIERSPTGQSENRQGLCGHREKSIGSGTRYSDGGCSRTSRLIHGRMARIVGAEGTPADVITKLNAAVVDAWRIRVSGQDWPN